MEMKCGDKHRFCCAQVRSVSFWSSLDHLISSQFPFFFLSLFLFSIFIFELTYILLRLQRGGLRSGLPGREAGGKSSVKRIVQAADETPLRWKEGKFLVCIFNWIVTRHAV